jgi:hypothetical protein
MPIQPLIKAELLLASNNVSDVNNTPVQLRDTLADAQATIIAKYIKLALTQVITAGMPVPNDGGAGLKTTMLAAITNL